jgi:DNA polymerase
MGRTVAADAGRVTVVTIPKDIKALLEFFDALGYERLPVMREKKRGEKKERREPQNLVASEVKGAALESLRAEIGDCQRCRLSTGRQHIVFGEGNPGADLVFIGEAPGREEDIQGRPFVGDAGKLLTRLIEKMGLSREDVYIANIVKCRPPMNRDPQEDEIKTCFPFINRQIELIAPKVIVSLGRISAHTLTGTQVPISKLRGKFLLYKGIPLMPTFHPAYLLRNPKDKWLVWEDAQHVLRKLQEDE